MFAVEALEARTLLAAPHPFDLGTLDGTNGFVLTGIDSDDQSGYSVSRAGDVNGDGFDDLIIGAYGADQSGEDSYEGENYVVFGKSGGFPASFSLSTLNGTNGFVLTGIDPDDGSGTTVRGAGDVNGDGFDDLLIVAGLADQTGGNTNEGESYVVFGKSSGFPASFSLSSLNGTNGFVLTGIDPNDQSGRWGLSSAGDVNGDGFDDLLIPAWLADQTDGDSREGESYVVFGKSGGFPASLSFSSLNGTNGFVLTGIDPGDVSGWSVSSAGDVNGDGFDDLFIGAWGADQTGEDSQEGESYVVFGKSSGFPASFPLSSLDGTNGFVLIGIDPGDHSFVVRGAGDVNGDGFDDLLIGARSADQSESDSDGSRGSQEGETYVVFGKSDAFPASFPLSSLNGTNGFVLTGIDPGDHSGPVTGAGDVNGDGFDDLLISASGADQTAEDSKEGEGYVVFGKSGGFPASFSLSSLNGTNGFVLTGIDPGDVAIGPATAGDVNGDGFDDLIIGARRADPAGESYVVFGGNFTGGIETQVGGDDSDTLTAVQGAEAVDILIGGRGNDTLVSDGGDDVLRGGEGDDILAIPDAGFSGTRRLQGGNGTDTLRLDGAGITLDLTAIADNRIIDIEQIDIRGGNTLTLNVREVLNLSTHSNTLLVQRGAEDTVNIGPGWTQQPNETIGTDTFEVFTQGAATLKVQASSAAADTIIDDGDAGYSDAGDWGVSSIEGRDGDVRFAPGGERVASRDV